MSTEVLIKLVPIILSFTGSLFLAFAVISNPHGAHQMIEGKKIPLALIHSKRAKIGVWLIAIGFFVQFFITLCSENCCK